MKLFPKRKPSVENVNVELEKSFQMATAGLQWSDFGIAPKKTASSWITDAKHISIVQIAVAAIVADMSNVDWVEFRLENAAGENQTEHPIYKRFHSKANHQQDARQFRSLITTRLLLAGEAQATIYGEPSKPVALHPVSRGQYLPIAAKPGDVLPNGEPRLIAGWERINGDGTKGGVIGDEQLFRAYCPNPADPFHGLSPLDGIGLPAEITKKAMELQWNVLNNHGASPFILLMKNANADDAREAVDYLKSVYQTTRNAGAPSALALGGDGEIVKGFTAEDVIKLASWDTMSEQILGMYRVSKAVLGLTSGETRANADAALKSFVERGLSYWAGLIASGIQKMVDEDLTVVVNFDNHPGMQEDVDAKHDRARKNFLARGITLDEFRTAVGFEEPITDLDTLGPPRPPVVEVITEAREDVDGASANPKDESKSLSREEKSVALRSPEAVEASFQHAVEASLPAFEGFIENYLERQQKRIVGRLKADWPSIKAILTLTEQQTSEWNDAIQKGFVSDLISKIFDKEGWNRELEKDAVAAYKPVLKHTSEHVSRILGMSISPGSWSEEVMARRVLKVTRINDATRDNLARVLSNAYENGSSIDQVVEALQPTFSKPRARTIARTEVVGATNEGTFEGYKASEIVEKIQWITAGDEKVRGTHAAVDGEIVKLGERFSNGLLYPGDPGGDAADVINCRCQTIAVGFKEDPEF